MPAFKRFGPGDQIDNVLILHPEYSLVSGSQGWFGSPEGSSSLYLYGGARRRPGVFTQVEYQSFAPNVGQTGNPKRFPPITASVQFAYVSSDALPAFQRTSTRWGEEHWDVLQRLYQDYSIYDPDYVTGSYDYYCLYLNKDSRNVVIVDVQDPNTSAFLVPTGSFTLEGWVKPFLTSSLSSSFTIQSMNSSFWLGITGSNGALAFSSSLGTLVTSSIPLRVNRWNHVAVTYDSVADTGSMYVNFVLGGTFASAAPITGSPSSYLSIGNRVRDDSVGFATATGVLGQAFHGFIGETRYWDSFRTAAQVSASAGARLTGSALAGPLSYQVFNEGPLAQIQALVAGSGCIDYSGRARGRTGNFAVGVLRGFDDRVGPSWHPNDNASFVVPKLIASASVPVSRMLVADVPSAFYGRQIVPGSVRMTCRAFESFGLVRTIVDDGRGGLYLSGSVASSSLESREDYAGVGWNKVGNVFYGEGLFVIKDPSLLDFGRTDGAFNDPTATFALRFRGDSRIPVKTLMCRVDHGEFNCTTNPTFFTTGSAGERLRRHSSGSIRVSTVGLYNSDRDLVGVARLADPVRIRPRDRINIRLKMDF